MLCACACYVFRVEGLRTNCQADSIARSHVVEPEGVGELTASGHTDTACEITVSGRAIGDADGIVGVVVSECAVGAS